MSDTARFRLSLALLALLAVVPAARADAPSQAATATAWFMRACVRFAAHPTALRHWADTKHLVAAPDKQAQTYLFGLPGAVFAIPIDGGPLILVSENSGSCSIIAPDVPGTALLAQVNAALTAAGVAFKITEDAPDPKAPELHDRAYAAHKGKDSWLMLVSTVTDPAGGEAILTTSP